MRIREIPFAHNTGLVSEKAYDEHLKLYKGYIGKSNEIAEELDKNAERDKANKTYSFYRGLKKGEGYAMDGVILHELYFRNIGGSETKPGARFTALAERNFGRMERWADDFIACAKSARGWCVACFEQRTGTLRNILQDAHDEGIITSSYPLLILDMYEYTRN
ncbi:MAG: Fe-Mn family superoxide dismutase [Defluviitaleaceae bacterium]|nr:Fe-Mn family superoxide dismutase [Defluviitaleaceae bacterium]